MKLFLIFYCLSVTTLSWAWTPQYGTPMHPRDPTLWPKARRGDVYNLQGALCMAKHDHVLLDPAHAQCMQDDTWLPLQHGTRLHPKKLHDERTVGDFVMDPATGKYYKVAADGYSLAELLEHEHWMGDLRPLIGDVRLGDLVIPATHDSGTAGIDEDSVLVDQNFLFEIGASLTPETVANWSRTQDNSLFDQLSLGFRSFDLRVADMSTMNMTDELDGDTEFYWWHGLTGDEITADLLEINVFASTYFQEIIILDMGHFAAPGNAFVSTRPIPDERLDELSDIILARLGERMVPYSLGSNPTVNEVLATGRNIIVIMHDEYIQEKDSRYWPGSVIYGDWSGASNPEDLFEERSGKLSNFTDDWSDHITELSGCCTPDVRTVTAALLTVYGDDPYIHDLLENIAPNLTNSDPHQMSFEGVYIDLLNMACDGVNHQAMWARDPEFYTNGGSVNFRGNGDMLRHWLSRPQIYKPNIINTDCSSQSDYIEIAIAANSGLIKRQVTIAHQGDSRDGFYEWDEYVTVGGSDGLACTSALLRVTIVDHPDASLLDQYYIAQHSESSFVEGQYPLQATVSVEASSDGIDWYYIYDGTIQYMIENNLDKFVRSVNVDGISGYAYISSSYNIYSNSTCDTIPDDGYDFLTFW